MTTTYTKPRPKKADVKLPPLQPDNTGEQQVVKSKRGVSDKQRAMLFAAGQSGNPAGRPKGSRNKLGEAFVADMLADWERCGAAVIQRVRMDDPSTYLRVVASILPKDINLGAKGQSNLEKIIEQFTDQQLAELDVALRAICAEPIEGSAAHPPKAKPRR